jgi:hypothetical protein
MVLFRRDQTSWFRPASLVYFDLVNFIKVCPMANLANTHLCNHRRYPILINYFHLTYFISSTSTARTVSTSSSPKPFYPYHRHRSTFLPSPTTYTSTQSTQSFLSFTIPKPMSKFYSPRRSRVICRIVREIIYNNVIVLVPAT